jgi:hypothetical protein
MAENQEKPQLDRIEEKLNLVIGFINRITPYLPQLERLAANPAVRFAAKIRR